MFCTLPSSNSLQGLSHIAISCAGVSEVCQTTLQHVKCIRQDLGKPGAGCTSNKALHACVRCADCKTVP